MTWPESGLPQRYSSFVGRDTELQATHDRLEQYRLVSLIGPGGIGKSSIALEAARNLANREIAVVHVAVESSGEGGVAHSTARSIGLEPAPNVDPVDVIAGYLSSRPHLLVLDGCEPYIREVAQLADRLLTTTDVILLATSREPLGLAGESTLRVDPLSVDAAVELFSDRAELPEMMDAETLETIRSTCRALDGMPLAIELAAARAKSVPLDRLAERMSDQIPLLKRSRSSDERHGSLLAALDWSYDLLDETRQDLLLALSVFVTPFSMKDAITMIGDPEVEDELAQLVQVSLLQPPDSSGRYRFLEPVRQYARHRLSQSGNLDNARSQHTDWIVASSRSAAALEWTPRMREMYSWIFDRREEMLAAVDFAVETDRPDVIIALMASSGNALRSAGIYHRFMGPAEAAVRNPEATWNTEYTAACNRTSRMALHDDRWDDAIEILKPGISAAEANTDVVGLADAKFGMALAVSRGEPVPEVFDLLEEANALAATAGTPADGYKLYTHAMLLDFANRFSEVAAVAEQARQWWEEHVGGPYWGYYLLMAGIREYEGDLESALALYERAGDLGEAESMYIHAAGAWEAAGIIAARLGERHRLDTVVERRRRIGEQTGIPAFIPLDIRFALESGNHRKVLDLAREWYSVRSAQKFAEFLTISTDVDFTIYGRVNRRPAVFGILRPVAAALLATGREAEACRIVESIPSILQEAPFQYWDEFREEELWSPLVAACGEYAVKDLDPMSLTELFAYTKLLVVDESSGG